MTSTTTRKPQPLTPYLTVADGQAAIAFYQQAFGAKVLSTVPAPDGKKLYHAHLDINGGDLMLSDDFPEANGGQERTPKALGGSPVTLHLDLTDVDATWQTAVAAGATVLMPLADQFWGDRFGILVDPSGHRWSLSTRKQGALDGAHLASERREHSAQVGLQACAARPCSSRCAPLCSRAFSVPSS